MCIFLEKNSSEREREREKEREREREMGLKFAQQYTGRYIFTDKFEHVNLI